MVGIEKWATGMVRNPCRRRADGLGVDQTGLWERKRLKYQPSVELVDGPDVPGKVSWDVKSTDLEHWGD